MLFNSFAFVFFFLPLAWAGFFLIGARNAAIAAGWLTLCSIFFYGYWSITAVPLLLTSIAVNHFFARLILSPTQRHSRATGKKALLVYAVTFNLSLLAFFKYANFLIDTVNAPLGLLGRQLGNVDITLPIGISFFTFTQIAYLVDAYRSEACERNPVHYTLFVTYFPHLIAGPVLHHKQMMPQFALPSTYIPSYSNITIGLFFFSLGLFKKVVIADELAPYADTVFAAAGNAAQPALFDAWGGALAYTFQLYFDFSGYCDMAIGISKLFNIELPINFNSPYKAANIIDFWRRWHITLSNFLRDYLYIPLGGNRKGKFARYKNLMITMLLGGLWHGASWTYVIWGGLHGLYLVINHAWRAISGGGLERFLPQRAAYLTGLLITFLATVFAWVAFRAPSLSSARSVYEGMLGANGVSLPQSFSSLQVPPFVKTTFDGVLPIAAEAGLSTSYLLFLLLVSSCICFLSPNLPELARMIESPIVYSRRRLLQATALLCAAAFVISIGMLRKDSPFLYFQF